MNQKIFASILFLMLAALACTKKKPIDKPIDLKSSNTAPHFKLEPETSGSIDSQKDSPPLSTSGIIDVRGKKLGGAKKTLENKKD